MNNAAPLHPTERIAHWQRRSLAVGLIALAVCILGGFFQPAQFFRAYLPAYLFYLGLALGSMAVLIIYHLTGGAWGFLIRRILEAGMRTLPLAAVFFAPIALGIRYLYPWAQPSLVAQSAKLQHESFFLNPPYFWMRAAAYFLLWLGMAFWLNSWSCREDRTGDARLSWKCRQLSAFGAVIYGVTLHFAAVDWAMSLLPAFHSTIWGPLFAVGQMHSALCLALIVLAVQVKRAPLAELVSKSALNDLGSLLLALLILWAYMAWFQFMLIWIANLPVDIIYYLPRTSAPWRCLIGAIFLLHFAVPFFLLLMRPLKRSAGALARIAGLILFMQLVYMYYQVTPMFPAATLGRHWMDFLAPIALGGIWLSHFLWQLGRCPLVAPGDQQQAAALHLRRLDDEQAAQAEAIGL
jgi:hypothetical protein